MLQEPTLQDPKPAPEHKIAPKTIELMLMRYGNIFVVKSIKNSTWYKPGDHITFDTAQKCCEVPNWQVTMIDNDILQMIFGHLTPIPLPIV